MKRTAAQRIRDFKDIPDDAIRGIGAPTLVVVGDADVMRPAHRSLVLVETEPDRLLDLLAKARPPVLDKWIEREEA